MPFFRRRPKPGTVKGRRLLGTFNLFQSMPDAKQQREGDRIFIESTKTFYEVQNGKWIPSPHGENLTSITTSAGAADGDGFVKTRNDGKIDQSMGGVADSLATLDANALLEQNLEPTTYTTLGSPPEETDHVIISDAGVAKKVLVSDFLDERKQAVDLSRTTTQGITASTSTYITYTTEVWDYGGLATVPGTKVTIPSGKGGLYLCVAEVEWAANAVGDREIAIFKNSAEEIRITTDAVGGGRPTDEEVVEVLELDSGDVVQVSVFHNSSTSPLNITKSIFEVVRMH